MAFVATRYLPLGDTWIRVYESYPIPQHLRLQTDDVIILSSMCCSYPLRYPYTWYIFGEEAAIVDYNDLLCYQRGLQPPPPPSPSVHLYPMITTNQHQQHQQEQPPYDSEYIDDVYILEQLTNQSNEETVSHQVQCSGLTKRMISKKLRVTKYCKKQGEEGELCVVCQGEYRSKERVAVLKCNHRYHPKCITEWFVRQNVCPVCKGEGLSV